jgi:hypothetical protein
MPERLVIKSDKQRMKCRKREQIKERGKRTEQQTVRKNTYWKDGTCCRHNDPSCRAHISSVPQT